MNQELQPSSNQDFSPTRWTLIRRAHPDSPEARSALSELCETYYQPVFRFIQREGRDPDSARELTQEFFARLLARGAIGVADPMKGRFRSYLLGAVKHFLADARKQAGREKRGGGSIHFSLDEPAPEDSAPREIGDPAFETIDHQFDREWALTVMKNGIEILEQEYNKAGKLELFKALQPWLSNTQPGTSQAGVAQALGLNEGALKVAIHRLRKRFREIIRTEISQTLETEKEIDLELRYLIEVLAGS